MDYKQDFPLSELTTFEIGGPAKFYCKVNNIPELEKALSWGSRQREKTLILGGGSSVLISDTGFDGLIIQLSFIETKIIDEDRDKVFISVQAGKNWDEFVKNVVENNWQGIECLSGIPGQVGAGLIQNIGAYGQEVANVVKEVKCFNQKSMKLEVLNKEDCDFSYRDSLFKRRRELIITEIIFAFEKRGSPDLKYKSLEDHFRNKNPSLYEVRNKVLEIRASKGMILDENDPDTKSVGSFFINPIIDKDKLKNILQLTSKQIPFWDQGSGRYKIPAAWLIENAGFNKGYKYKNVGISTKHCLALINCGGGTAKEIMKLARKIQNEVESKYGIRLKIEPYLLGF